VQAGFSSLIDWRRPNLGGVIFNVLIYFTLGLILLSQVNLSRLMIHWRVQNITPPAGLARKWAQYGLAFLGLVMLIAFLLPTRYTLGFLATAAILVQFLINLFVFLFQLVIILITLPLTWLLSLFGVTTAGGGPEAGPPPVLPPPAAGATYPWLEVLRSLIFWLVALGIIGYLLKIYLEDHPELLESLKKFRPLNLILQLLGSLWAMLRGWTQAGLEMIPSVLKLSRSGQNGASGLGGITGWLGLRRLSARERILYYYLNILERAKKKASGRKQHETPYEYEPNLSQSAPDAKPEVHDLTDIFVQARYSQKPFNEAEATLVKREWQQIRNALRRGNSKDSSDA
jgi:hypothetical protein